MRYRVNQEQMMTTFSNDPIGINVGRCEEHNFDTWDVYLTSYRGLSQLDQHGNSFSVSAPTQEDAIRIAKEKYRSWLEEKGHWGLAPKVAKKNRRKLRR